MGINPHWTLYINMSKKYYTINDDNNLYIYILCVCVFVLQDIYYPYCNIVESTLYILIIKYF